MAGQTDRGGRQPLRVRFTLAALLIHASLVDIRPFVIPAQTIVLAALLGVAEHLRLGDLKGLRDGLIGAAGAAAAFKALRRLSAWRRGQPGLGAGDGLLAAALTVWVGWERAPLMVAGAARGGGFASLGYRQRGNGGTCPDIYLSPAFYPERARHSY